MSALRHGLRVPAAVLGCSLGLACGEAKAPAPAPTPTPVAVATPSTAPSLPMTPPPRPFTDEVRMAIYQEALRAEARANQEAVAANPDAGSIAGGGNPEKMVRRIQKRGRVSEALEQKYRAEIAARYGISEIELRAIVDEGKGKGWPSPSPQ